LFILSTFKVRVLDPFEAGKFLFISKKTSKEKQIMEKAFDMASYFSRFRRSSRRARSHSGFSGAAVVVFYPLDIVLAEIVTSLYLDEHQVLLSVVFNPVKTFLVYVRGLADHHFDILAVERHHAFAVNDVPVLGAAAVPLVAEALARVHGDSFYLAVIRIQENFIEAPRAVIFSLVFCHDVAFQDYSV
jgi:hypothetical protein